MKLTDNIPKKLAPGLLGYYAHGENLTFGIVEIKAGSDLPLHYHMHEQITYILEGELEMVIGDEKISLTSGMVYVIPPNIPHGAFAVTDCKLIDVFTPSRDDYR